MSEPVTYLLDFEKPLAALQEELERLKKLSEDNKIPMTEELEAIKTKIKKTKREIYAHLTPWQKVKLARHPRRPYALDYIRGIFENFQELHGDRRFGDDQALIGGIAYLGQQPVMVLGQQKGRDLKENLRRNFGCPNPEGYRKALRLMQLAEQFSLPVVSFVDTPGAYPGVGSEERHIAEAIAVNLREMSILETPMVVIVIGEGGSGGALGIGVADRVFVLENAYYSVISPEGCASILWKDATKAPDAAEALKMSAADLKQLGVIDGILKEPLGGAHANPEACIKTVKNLLEEKIPILMQIPLETLLQQRYEKFRRMGVFEEI